MTDLYEFQAAAAEVLVDRVSDYIEAPVMTGRKGSETKVPLLQLLDSITASGKTIILAEAVSGIAERSPVPPVVLWLSKMTVVVGQTFASLSPGGKLHDLIGSFKVVELSSLDPEDFTDTSAPVLVFATVGTFNQSSQADGSLRVFRQLEDLANQSRWEMLTSRGTPSGERRPLIVVYDEAHNLTDQQSELLLSLDPDAFLLSTATQKPPRKIHDDVVNKLLVTGFDSSDMQVIVDASQVAASGLIKPHLHLVGRQAPAESVIDEMVDELKALQTLARVHGIDGTPKAVYVTKTNIVEGTGEREDHKQPFNLRNVPPILIWRQLVENLSVDPSEIAVYCDLKVDKNFPLPAEFELFPGGTNSYSDFVSRDFTHIIFNLALQEGWDDPLVYSAYIDRSMGSKVQAEQVVGRLLRQPGRRHYEDERLNRATIFVRVESTGVFDSVVSEVRTKLEVGGLPIKMTKAAPGTKSRGTHPPRKRLEVPRTTADTGRTSTETEKILAKLHDYAIPSPDTTGAGKIARVQRLVGQADGSIGFEWTERGHTAQVTVRWLFRTALMKRSRRAFDASLVEHEKFDRKVGHGSNAALHVDDVADQVAKAYLNHSFLKLNRAKPYVVSEMLQHEEGFTTYSNSAHQGYSGLNSLEKKFAEAADAFDWDWCCNPPRVGYGIPVIAPGTTDNFYPDFLVWSDGDVYCIDTKGPHLHSDAERKMMAIRPGGDGPRVFVRFITQGAADANGPLPDSSGFTTWRFGAMNQKVFTHFETMAEAISDCVTPDL